MAPLTLFYLDPKPDRASRSRTRKVHTVKSEGKAERGRGAIRRMDMTWVTDRIAVGGGIWNEEKMIEVVRAGVTHIVDMQIEFDDTRLAEPYGVKVLWNPTDDDFRPKPPELLQRGVDFAVEALGDPGAKVFIHCAAGVHRAPMMTLAVLRATGWPLQDAIEIIECQRPVADFAQVYVESVEEFMKSYEATSR
jgi:protein-tyrosine phosphatase